MYAIVYHPCYRTLLEGGYRVYPTDSDYLRDHPSMYVYVSTHDTLEEAEYLMGELEWQYLALSEEFDHW